jgi:hypothetical protein
VKVHLVGDLGVRAGLRHDGEDLGVLIVAEATEIGHRDALEAEGRQVREHFVLVFLARAPGAFARVPNGFVVGEQLVADGLEVVQVEREGVRLHLEAPLEVLKRTQGELLDLAERDGAVKCSSGARFAGRNGTPT